MSEVSRSALFSKLNKTLYKSLENAFFFAKLRENRFVEILHWLYQLEQQDDNDLFFIQKHFGLNQEIILNDLEQRIGQLKSGHTAVNDFSDDIIQLIEETWLYSSLKFSRQQIRSGHILYCLLISAQFKRVLLNLSDEFAKISPELLQEELFKLCKDSIEQQQTQADSASGTQALSANGQSSLAKFATNLTEQARENKLDPVTARDDEIRQMIKDAGLKYKKT